MAVDASTERAAYVTGLQNVAKLILQLNAQMNGLNTLYQGGGLSGTFVDAEVQNNNATKHLTGADIGTFTANLNTVQAALTVPILNNMAKAVGTPV